MEQSDKYYILTAEEYRRLAGNGGQTPKSTPRADPLVDPLVTNVRKGRANLASADPTASSHDRVLRHAQKLERYLSDIRKLKRKSASKRDEVSAALGRLTATRGDPETHWDGDETAPSPKRPKASFEYKSKKREVPYDSPLARQISEKGGYYTPDGSLVFRRKSFPAEVVADLLRDAESPQTERRRSPVDDWKDFSKTLIESGLTPRRLRSGRQVSKGRPLSAWR